MKVERCYLMPGTSERKKSWYYLNWSSDEEVHAAEDIFATTIVQQMRRSTWSSSTLYGTYDTWSSSAARLIWCVWHGEEQECLNLIFKIPHPAWCWLKSPSFRRASECCRRYICNNDIQHMRRSTWPRSTLYGTSETCPSFAANIELMWMSLVGIAMFKPDSIFLTRRDVDWSLLLLD